MIETWIDIKGYEGVYQVSSLGRIKGLARKTGYGNRSLKEKILKLNKNAKGYCVASLCKKGQVKMFLVHRLVYENFIGELVEGMVIDHKNNIRHDNYFLNLQQISYRTNSSKDKTGYTSKYLGVSWCIINKNWKAQISINKKTVYLGRFKDEMKASKIYQEKLKQLKLP